MNASVLHAPPSMSTKMTRPMVFSLIFHAVVILIAIFGLPYITPPPPVLDDPVSVDIMTPEQMNTTDKPPMQAEKFTRPVEDERKPEKELPKPPMPTVKAEAPPKPTPPKPPEKDKVEDKPKEKVEPLAVPLEKAQEEKKKDKKKPLLTKPEEEKKQEDQFQSVLKNLMESQPTPAEQQTKAPLTGETPSPMASLANRMTMGEMDALKQQLAGCWNVTAGARYAEDIIVDIKLFMNPDRTVREARVVDQMRYNGDSFFRASADSAVRAVLNPQCNPLELPPNKYDQWKEMTVSFDPREML